MCVATVTTVTTTTVEAALRLQKRGMCVCGYSDYSDYSGLRKADVWCNMV